ncbi:polysaccharide lyase 8 family protein [Microbispora sp. NBC_01189]|uniref:polysaccharide lyase 8 family protein n=1 Tax=Microbispora sp. NBC_01189 TaxID=2903583 RepID=UPI002E14F000|nr:polysaccharide lyase 8 family protein [Microbispora sp. NBC_01189]
MKGPSRRLFLQFSGLAVLLTACAPHTGPATGPATGADAEASAEALILLGRRWREVTLGAGLFDPAREPYRARLARLGAAARLHRDALTPTGRSLWPDLPFPSLGATPARLRAMARAYALPGTGLTAEPGLGSAVATGIEHYVRQVYAADAGQTGNWWDWQIGAPRALLDAAVLAGPHLTGGQHAALCEAVDNFVPPDRLDDYAGNSTGANRVDLCTVTLLRAIAGADPGRAALAVSALSPVFRYVTEGDGFYRDGSFVQHGWVPYQGGYGAVALTGLATLAAVLRGTPWEIADPAFRNVLDAVDRSFAPFVHDGACLDLVRGRGVARRPYGDHARGREIAAAILLLAETAPAADRARWRGMVKGWAARDTAKPMLRAAEGGDPAFHARLAAVLRDETTPAAPEPPGHRLFPMSARAVHRRPGWCAALSMASSRVAHYEHGNGENPRGWHTGAGMLYWWGRGHGDQYSDSFWPTVDPYRLPGTTVSTLRLPDGAGGAWGDARPPAEWVGGATDGAYAAVGQHLYGLESTLEAFKSWFFLDDAVVCLGAGITSRDGVPVETVVDNRRTGAALTGAALTGAALTGAALTGAALTGAALTVDAVAGWAHLDGHGGYVLPPGQPLRTLRETRTAGGATRSYATIWLDHGVDPDAAGYVYHLMPGAGPAATRARAADAGWARVLANTSAQQGIEVPSLGITAACFWAGGRAGRLAASDPCAVLVRDLGDGTATVTVADPRADSRADSPRDLDGLTVTWDRAVAGIVDPHPLLGSARTGARLTIVFGRSAAQAGASRTVTVRLA